MQLTGELAPLGYAHRETEFIIAPSGPLKGQRIYGACGPTALASAASAALGHCVTTEQAYAAMLAHGLCDNQGVTKDGKLARAAALFGLSIAEHRAYGEPWAGWPTFLGWHLGSRAHPVLLQVANGQALRDDISGMSENASGLRYHFIMLLKRHAGGASAYAGGRTLRSGYWACDGDSFAGGNDRAHNFAAKDVLQFYPDSVIAAAQPCAAIAFNRVAATGGQAVWKVISPGVVADSHGVKAEYAMASYIESNLSLGDVVAGCPGETYIDNGQTSILPLEGATSLVYTKADGRVHPDKSGEVLWQLWQRLQAAENAKPDPQAVKAEAAIDAIKAALG